MKSGFPIVLGAIIMLIIAGLPFPGTGAENNSKAQWQCITIAEISLLSMPHPTGKVVDKIPKGTTLQILAESKDDLIRQNWLKVAYGGKSGWISDTLVDKVHPPVNHVEIPVSSKKPGETWIKVITPDNRARLSPIPDSVPQNRELLRIRTGTALKVEDVSILKSSNRRILPDAKWYKVSYGGKIGWVSQYDVEVQR